MMQIMKWDDNIAAMEAEKFKAPGIHLYIELYRAKLESV